MARKSRLQEKESLDSWARMHLEFGEAIGRKNGLIRGKREAKFDMIQMMMSHGICYEKALAITKLSPEEYKIEERWSRTLGLGYARQFDSWAELHLEIGATRGRKKALNEAKVETKLEIIQAMIKDGIPKQKALAIAEMSAQGYSRKIKALEKKKPQLKKRK
jgi:hypothetical protein